MPDNNAQTRLSIDTQQFIAGLGQATQVVSTYSTTVSRATDAEERFSSRPTQQRVDQLTNSVSKAQKQHQKYGQQVLQTLEAFIRYNIVNQIFNRITRGIRDSIGAARELELGLAQALTIANNEIDFGGLQGQVLDISGDFGLDAAGTAEAVYFALSNQVGNTAEAIDFVRESAEFAEGAFIDLTSAVNLTSGVLTAYGENASATARINDQLFRAIELGRVTAAQLEGNLGSVIGPAADLGVAFDELLVSVDQLTLSGVPVERAMTGIRNILFSLLKPSDDLDEALRQIGASSVEAAIAQNGLLGTLGELAGTTTGLSSELAKLFPNIRAFAATGPLFRAADGALQEFNDGLEGASERAQELVRATEAKELERNLQQFRNVFTKDVGGPIIEVTNDIIETFGGAEVAAEALAITLNTLAIPVGALIAAFSVQTIIRFGTSMLFAQKSMAGLVATTRLLTTNLGISTAAAIRLQRALALVNVFAAGLAVGAALGVLINQLRDSERGAKRAARGLKDLNDTAQRLRADGIEDMNREIERVIRNLREERRVVFTELNKVNAEFLRQRDLIVSSYEVTTQSLKSQLQERQNIVQAFLNGVTNAAQDTEQRIRDAVDVARDLERSVSDARFQAEFRRLQDDPRAQARLIESRIQELLAAARQAEAAGESADSDRLQQDAVNLANQLLNIEGQRSRGLTAQNRVLAAADQIQAKRIEREQQLAASAREQSGTVLQQATELEALQAQILTLQKQLSEAEGIDRQRFEVPLKAATDRYNELLKEIKENPLASQLLNQQQLSRLTDTFFNALATNLENRELELDVLIRIDAQQLQAELDAAQQKADPKGLIPTAERVTGRPFGTGPTGGGATIRDLTEIGKAREEEERVRGEQKVANDKIIDLLGNLRTQLKESLQEGARIPFTPFFSPTVGLLSDDELAQVKNLGQSLQDVDNINIEDVRRQINLLPEELSGFATAAQSQLKLIQDQADASDEAKARLDELAIQIGDLDVLINEAKETRAAEIRQIKLYNPTAEEQRDAIDANTKQFNQNTDAVRQFLEGLPSFDEQRVQEEEVGNVRDAVADGVETAVRALQLDRPPEDRFRANGGSLFRASGGGIGTDVIPVMASPGEFMMNAQATRKFHSQLVAMNAGLNPTQYRQSGGDINNNISLQGDLVINNPTETVDPVMIHKALRRASRKGTI